MATSQRRNTERDKLIKYCIKIGIDEIIKSITTNLYCTKCFEVRNNIFLKHRLDGKIGSIFIVINTVLGKNGV